MTSPGTSAVGVRNVESLLVLIWSCPNATPFASRAKAKVASVLAPRVLSDDIETEKSPLESVTEVLNARSLLGMKEGSRR